MILCGVKKEYICHPFFLSVLFSHVYLCSRCGFAHIWCGLFDLPEPCWHTEDEQQVVTPFPTPGWLGVGFNLSGHPVFLLILSRRRERFLVIVPCHSCDQELLTGDKLGKSWLTPCGDSDPIVAPIVSLEKSKKLGWLGLDFLWINWAQEMTYFFNIPWGKQVVTSEKSVS